MTKILKYFFKKIKNKKYIKILKINQYIEN